MGDRTAASDLESPASYSAVEAGLFGLLGLLLAFTFSGAVTRFDERRQAISTESNAISTAYRSLELLPAENRDLLQAKFKEYLAARLAESRRPQGFVEESTQAAVLHEETSKLQTEIWLQIVAANRKAPSDAVNQVLLPAINEMFSIARSRVALASRHPPLIIYVMLFAFAALCSLIAGYAMGPRASRVHVFSFAASLALSLFLILEIEFPRQGIVRLDKYDALLAKALGDR